MTRPSNSWLTYQTEAASIAVITDLIEGDGLAGTGGPSVPGAPECAGVRYRISGTSG